MGDEKKVVPIKLADDVEMRDVVMMNWIGDPEPHIYGGLTHENSIELPQYKKIFTTNFGVGEACIFQLHGGEGGRIAAVVTRVIFEAVKVRFDLQCLNGATIEGAYSQRVLPLDDEWRDILNRPENKEWVAEVRKDLQNSWKTCSDCEFLREESDNAS